jgi:ATP diphosphatase
LKTYEVLDAIAREDFDDLRGELGDLLFQVVFYAQMAQEEGALI